MDANEIGELLGMSMKTFYAHRRSLIFKLQLGNRVSLYRNIARIRMCKQCTHESGLA
ncbi:hypothetical protein ACDI96_07910 [Citrobacter telavivensis]